MQVFMVAEVMDWADPLITISERIKKVMLNRQDQRSIQTSNTGDGTLEGGAALLQQEMRERRVGASSGFPVILEKEVEAFNVRKRAEKKLLFEHNS